MDDHTPTSNVPPDQRSSSTPPSTPPKKKKRIWPWFILLILIAAVFYGALHRGKKNASMANTRFGGPVTITTVTAKKGEIGVYINAIGTVTALHTVSITSQVTGVITAIHYREGQFVQKGASLVDIDPRQFQAQVIQAQGNLERDQGVLAESKMDLVRYQQAWAHNAIPLQTLDDQQKKVIQDEGTVKYDQGVLDYDKVQLSYCHITAPMAGRVGLRLVDPGNLVTANSSTPLIILTTMDPITVVATITEGQLGEVFARPDHGVGLPLEAWNKDDDHEIGTGRVTSFDNQIDTQTGTIKLRATFNNNKGELYPNEFVNTRLLVKTLTNQTLAPVSAVQQNGQASYVYLIQKTPKGLHAVMHSVTTGVSNNGETVVYGIQPGDVLADSGFEKLRDGSAIRVSTMNLSPETSESSAP